MQTFLPFPDFYKSAQSIDKKRCWKQVVEAAQILDILSGKESRSKNHPAIKMWEGYEECLKVYFNAFLDVCKEVHKINTKYTFLTVNSNAIVYPWWWNNQDFHKGMQARLIEKDREFYLPKFPDSEGFNDGKYWWPVMDGSKTFKTI